ncbi:phosphatase PAP2 family protein [Natronobeatus ordinarius]|uniref:phosphatase PAP2 family protein n=1 Tax=Natronobeatus ordinarius TaxID=2963433 RepID=UPI0020CF89C0|nr:phosphatase PAP2 family protein [Natronobeatus ordinarius]
MRTWTDPAVVESVRDAFPEWTALVFAILSSFGSVWFVAPVVVLAYWYCDRHRSAPWLGVVIGGYAVMTATKAYFDVPRPAVDPAVTPESLPTLVAPIYGLLVEVDTSAFPSGHALAAVIVWGLLALEVDVGTRGQRTVVAGVMVILVSLSRIVLGVHFPADVVAGAAIGVCYLATVLFVIGRVSDRDDRRSGTVAFALAAGIAAISFVVSGNADAATLFGGALGGLFAWQFAAPPRQPWPRNLHGATLALSGIGLLALVALVLVLTDGIVVRFAVGAVAAVVVVSLPSFASSKRQRGSAETASD